MALRYVMRLPSGRMGFEEVDVRRTAERKTLADWMKHFATTLGAEIDPSGDLREAIPPAPPIACARREPLAGKRPWQPPFSLPRPALPDETPAMRAAAVAAYDAARRDVPAAPSLIDAVRAARGRK